MKFSNSLSSRLLLALSLTVSSVFLTNAVKAETVQPKPIVQVNPLQNPVNFFPHLGKKVDFVRHQGLSSNGLSNVAGRWNTIALEAAKASFPQLLAQVVPPQLQPKYVEVASVLSQPRPQSGEKNRSSGNFSIGSLPSGTTSLYWQVVRQNGTSELPGASFRVMRGGGLIDRVIFNRLANGSTSSVRTNRSLYIANPSGANENFIVKVYAVYQTSCKGV